MTEVQSAVGRVPMPACTHEELDEIGTGGRAIYYRCPTCGATIIEDGARFWTIRPAA